MQYWKTLPAIFLSRPNRFIAVCQLGEETVTVHVKNTGRCAELLVPGCTVWLEPARTEGRKTPYDLIAVEKGEKLINMDAQAPNAVTEEALRDGSLCLPGIVFFHAPMSFRQLGFLMLAGLCGCVAQFAITRAYLYAPAKELSVYDYTQVIFATVWGYLLFDQVPDGLSVLGYLLVCGAGVGMFLYHKRQDRKLTPHPAK